MQVCFGQGKPFSSFNETYIKTKSSILISFDARANRKDSAIGFADSRLCTSRIMNRELNRVEF